MRYVVILSPEWLKKVWADRQLENDPRFLRRIEESRRSVEAGRGVRLEDVED
jgi:hypothetical protein